MRNFLLFTFISTALFINAQKVAFIGTEADVASLADDDAKAAAEFMSTTYGSSFKYLQASAMQASDLADVNVVMLYYLTASDQTYTISDNSNPFTMLPAELQNGGSAELILEDFVKNGGNLFVAGDPTPITFALGRVPADFTAARAPGNYVYSEFNNGSLETGKASDDYWGLGVRDANNSGNQRNHPIFSELTFEGDGELYLNNAPDREVRLIWAPAYDNILTPSCCGSDAADTWEKTLHGTKLGTLRHVGDAFGYGAVVFKPTSGTAKDAMFDNNIPTDFKGTIVSFENTIIGYEWNPNGGTNDVHSNIEKITKNVIAFLDGPTPTQEVKVAFIGTEADVASLADDDAKAAAEFMSTTYGSSFKYLQASAMQASDLADVNVVMLYYLTASDQTYTISDNSNPFTMLPAELQNGGSAELILEDFVKNGGNLFVAGDPTPITFALGRVPADFTAARAPGNYVYSEFNNGSLETGKASDDYWGLGVRDANNSGNQRNHPIFSELTFEGDGELYLNNAPDREVRLIWAPAYDNILTPSCCGSDAADTWEKTLHGTKLGTLRHVGDAFGYGAVVFKPTSGTAKDAMFDNNIPTDFKGTIVSFENTIIGYEWNPNGGTNDVHSNIEKITKNVIAYLNGPSPNNPLSISNIKSLDLTIYPNPVQNTLFISGLDNVASYSVYDITGKELIRGNTTNSVDVQALNSGLYLLKVYANHETSTVKFLKR